VNRQPSEAEVSLQERYSSAVEHLDWTIHEEGHLHIGNKANKSVSQPFSGGKKSFGKQLKYKLLFNFCQETTRQNTKLVRKINLK